MNMFKAFESRVGEIFGSQQASAPFSFKRLARRTAREMEAETYVVDDVNTAPALFTILVSADDDALMRPLYGQLADEISSLVEAEAARKGYVFVGKPLARFMVDNSLRRGRFAVFANNIDAGTLEKLREEEEAFLSGFGAFGGAALSEAQIVTPLEQIDYAGDVLADEDEAATEVFDDSYASDDELFPKTELFPEEDDLIVADHALSDDSSAGLTVLPADFVDDQLVAPAPLDVQPLPEPIAVPTPSHFAPAVPDALALDEALPVVDAVVAEPVAAEPVAAEPIPMPEPAIASGVEPVKVEKRALADALPEVRDVEANPIVTEVPEVVGRSLEQVPEVSAAPAEFAVPSAPHHMVPNTQDSTVGVAPVHVVEPEPITCLLIDRQSGRTYVGTAPKTYIGRERTPGGITLHDPNVSRRHSELTYDGRVWRIHDLGSTNGTLVNDMDIDTCVLRDGDLITLGLLNLEFRES